MVLGYLILVLDHEFGVRFAGALWLGWVRLEPKLQAHATQLHPGRGREATVIDLRARRRRMLVVVAATRATLRDALGGELEPEQIAEAVTRGAEQLLDLAAATRDQTVPAGLEHARELTARLADLPLRAVSTLVESVAGSPDPEAPLALSAEELRIDTALDAELARALGATS